MLGVSDWDQLLVLVSEVLGTLGQIDVVFANAGWSAHTSFLRAECVGTGVRVTLIQPGLTDAGPAGPGREADPKLAPADVAAAVMYAVGQPAGVDVSEIVIRPVGQDPFR